MNRSITSSKVRVINGDGSQAGILEIAKALELAEEAGLDLVEVSGKSDPPVCRIMDYGKYRYQLRKREQDAKKKQSIIRVKEIKLRPKTEEHDFQFKLRHVRNFLKDGNKVKITLQYRGREIAYTYMGVELLERFIKETEDVGVPENEPRSEGRATYMILAPKKTSTKK